MPELIVFPDAEAVAVSWLQPQLVARGIAIPVATKVPNPRPPRFVRVVRTGGAQRDLVTDRATLVFECWDSSDPGAAQLAAVVRALLGAAVPGWLDTAWSDRIVDLGMVPSPDLDAGSPRHLVTAELHLRGTAL
ncbi:hypothetical protein [Nocardia thailandica]